ncbi:MAG: hypothetical protein AB8B60_02475 [Sulfitobacter sp.]
MTLTVEQMMERIDALQAELDHTEEEALENGVIDAQEERDISRVRRRLSRAHEQLMRHMERNPDAGSAPVRTIRFDADEEEPVQGELIGVITLGSRRATVRNSLGNWRTECKTEVGRLIRNMSEDNSDPFPRDLVVGIVASVLPGPVATALNAVNTAFTLVSTIYQNELPPQPTLSSIEHAWNQSMDQIAPDEIFDQLMADFQRQYGMPATDDTISGGAVREWENLTDSVSAGNALPAVNDVKRDFMDALYRAMPTSNVGPISEAATAGHVRVRLELDRNRRQLSFVSGTLENASDEMLNGLRTQPEVFGRYIIDVPAPMEFRIYDTSRDRVTDIIRRSTDPGSTDFHLSPVARGDANLEEQGVVFDLFMRSQVYNVAVSEVL